ncbi:hypothetical protein HMPREF0620_0226 [Parascardovia denticolens DSM 10105 = JCM 12538]|uniref:Uncharacterized protein n=1 Tax=Parascardovia denticolens DSM 10105 = JCM 12538 TaxID=864564 RepID=E6JZX9_PARDN|nr:hypothetical protein HMPREF0620_0226 [Parascardovia denticolens DSM 10105 = JCM 12538]
MGSGRSTPINGKSLTIESDSLLITVWVLLLVVSQGFSPLPDRAWTGSGEEENRKEPTPRVWVPEGFIPPSQPIPGPSP